MATMITPQAPDRSELFWQLVEAQHGRVEAFGLSQYAPRRIDTDDDSQRAKKPVMHWGISYITAQGVFFYHFPQGNILGSLLGQKPDSGFCIGIPLAKIQEWYAIIPKKSLSQLFKKKEHGLFVRGTAQAYPLVSPENTEHSLTYTNDMQKQLILDEACIHAFLLDFKEAEMLMVLRKIIGDKEKNE